MRFTDYTNDCDLLIDDIITSIENVPENLALFCVKKFYNNAYFSDEQVIN